MVEFLIFFMGKFRDITMEKKSMLLPTHIKKILWSIVFPFIKTRGGKNTQTKNGRGHRSKRAGEQFNHNIAQVELKVTK